MIMGKPVICVSSDSNNREKKGAEPRQHYSPAAYSRAIAAAGGVPVIAPEQCCGEMAELCDALLLTGGDDVCPELYGEEIAEATVVQYGGSMNAANAEELLSKPNVDGGLIGGASLKADAFGAIVAAASK